MVKKLLILLLAACVFCVGVVYGQGSVEPKAIETRITIGNYFHRTYGKTITVEEALEIISDARYSHQVQIDRGEPYINSLNWELKWVERYDQLRELIIRLGKGGKQ